MKYIAALILLVGGFGIYQIQSKSGIFNTGDIGKATAIGFTDSTTSVSVASCQSAYQINRMQAKIAELKLRLANLSKEQSSTTKALTVAKAALKKAQAEETAATPPYARNRRIYPIRITELEQQIRGIQISITRLRASTTDPVLEKKLADAKALKAKNESEWSKINLDYKKIQSNVFAYKKTVDELTALRADITSGRLKKRLTTELNTYENPKTGLLVLLKTKPACPMVEAGGRSNEMTCRDGIDNDMNGSVDCQDIACGNDTQCKNTTTTSTNTNTTTSGVAQTTGYCSDGGYTTQSSCENATIESCPDSSESEDGQIGGDCQTVNAGYTWIENDEPTGGDVCEADSTETYGGWNVNFSFFGYNKGNTFCGTDIGECIKGAVVEGNVRESRDAGTMYFNWTCAKDDATGRPECRFKESCSKIVD